MQLSFTDDSAKAVWMDVSKTREQLKPGRMVRRAYEFMLAEITAMGKPTSQLELTMAARQVRWKGQLAIYLRRDTLVGTTWAKDELGFEIIEACVATAASD